MLAGHETLLATVASFGERSGALRVLALVDKGDGEHAATIEWRPGGSLQVSEDERAWTVSADAIAEVAPLPLAPVRAVPSTAIDIDAETGQVEAPIGAMSQLASALRDLAAVLGGRSVALADFATRDADRPFLLAAREGEPTVLAIDEQRFELPE
jgi:hypothetical protein